jgi:hypothetical protein
LGQAIGRGVVVLVVTRDLERLLVVVSLSDLCGNARWLFVLPLSGAVARFALRRLGRPRCGGVPSGALSRGARPWRYGLRETAGCEMPT